MLWDLLMISIYERIAVLIDGEWFKKSLQTRLGSFPDYPIMKKEIFNIVKQARRKSGSDLKLYRVFYYTADPLESVVTNPLDRKVVIDFAKTAQYKSNAELIDKLGKTDHIAIRKGRLLHRGWSLRPSYIEKVYSASSKSQTIASAGSRDIKPNIVQKGVDMMMGIDMTSLALKRLVSTVVLATGDSDLVPAMKLARTEGLRVCLVTFRRSTTQSDLSIHNDCLLEI